MIRIAICDDHPMFRAGITGLLRDEGDIRVALEAASAGEIARAVAQRHAEIDLALLDLDLPDRNGLEIIGALSDHVRVLVISAFDDPRVVRTALESGAVGFVRKDAPAAVLLRGIRDAAQGKTVLAPELAVRVAGAVRTDSAEREISRRLGALTVRQHEVLDLLAEGKTNREIALALFVSEGTVKNHVTELLRLLDVPDRTRLAILLARRGGAR